MVTLSMLSFCSCSLYCGVYEISGAASDPFPENWMIATGTSMTKTQNESCLETLLQFVGFFGVLFGICIGITAGSLCTANGGSSPRDPDHIQPETHSAHQNQRTWPRTSVLRRSACGAARRSPTIAAGAPSV